MGMRQIRADHYCLVMYPSMARLLLRELTYRARTLCYYIGANSNVLLPWYILRFAHLNTFSRDPRSPAAPRRIHSYTHSDDITAVHFLKPYAGRSYANLLLSASSDGLLCTSNPEEDDEDEAGLHVGNWGTSVAQAGWVYGRSNTPTIWSSSDMETFGTWSYEVRFF